jgi:hypothetical protein
VQRQVVWKILGPSDWLASMPDEVRCAYRLIGDENVSVMRWDTTALGRWSLRFPGNFNASTAGMDPPAPTDYILRRSVCNEDLLLHEIAIVCIIV